LVTRVVDIHPHIISADDATYPRAPLFGIQSDWSKERPTTIEALIAAMDAAGVDKAAIVHASTCYGFDNSYLADSLKKHPGRITGVGSVDVLAADAPAVMRGWVQRGITGFRIFTGGSTAEFDTSALDDPASFPAWRYCEEANVPMCVQTGPVGLAQVAGLAKRFPKVNIILDHFARPDTTDGAPYHKAVSLFALAAFENIYLKISPAIIGRMAKAPADSTSFMEKTLAAFGAKRIAWGSNFPTSPGSMSDHLAQVRAVMAPFSEDEQAWVLARTAQALYPALKD
jgi:predicted TIM-barrel fold metal-dependent hydrolase